METDIVWFIEHNSRELDVACAVVCLLEKNYKKRIKIAQYNYPKEVIGFFCPKIVILPYCYSINDANLKSYLFAWPNAFYFNLAWEQIFYKANLNFKAPRDYFAKKFVYYHSWSEERTRFLIQKEVPKDHIFTNGHPAYKLYDLPYRKVFKTRNKLAKEFHLDEKKKWIFLPENYSWFFYTNHQLEEIIKAGQNREIAYLMRDYCGRAFWEVVKWLFEAVQVNKDLEIILRPRPAITLSYFKKVLSERLPSLLSNITISKEYSVREWILASDVVISSFSTSLIEAAIAEKPIFILEPFPIPSALTSSWYKYVKKVTTCDNFLKSMQNDEDNENYLDLYRWARKEFFVNEDPIMGLANYFGNLQIPDLSGQKEKLEKELKATKPNITTTVYNFLGKFKRNFGKEKFSYQHEENKKEIINRYRVFQKFLK